MQFVYNKYLCEITTFKHFNKCGSHTMPKALGILAALAKDTIISMK